jgi:hypothetical protein
VTEEQLEKLLDVYTLEEILERAGVEVVEVLSLLDELGYLKDLDVLEPL